MVLDMESASCAGLPLREECLIPGAALHRVLIGVGVATKIPKDIIQEVDQQIFRMRTASLSNLQRSSSHQPLLRSEDDYSYQLVDCYKQLLQRLDSEITQQIAILTVSVAFIRQHSRDKQESSINPITMSFVWKQLYSVLTDQKLDPPLLSATRSSQGFLSVGLCSLIIDGKIDEFIKFHVWLPDRNRTAPGLHSHQPFAQSYILAGTGTDLSYTVTPTTSLSHATHAEYELAWSDGKNLSKVYKTHQTLSAIANTGRLVHARLSSSATHTRDMTYTVPHAHFHTSTVDPSQLHATIFFFDAQRGFEKNAGVLGPVDGTSFIALRDPAGVTAAQLARRVQAVREWEVEVEEGKRFAGQGELVAAVNWFEKALVRTESAESFPMPGWYRDEALAELEVIQRRLEQRKA